MFSWTIIDTLLTRFFCTCRESSTGPESYVEMGGGSGNESNDDDGVRRRDRQILNMTTGGVAGRKEIEAAIRTGQRKDDKNKLKKSAPGLRALAGVNELFFLDQALRTFLSPFNAGAREYIPPLPFSSSSSSSSATIIPLHDSVLHLKHPLGVKFAKTFCDIRGNTAKITTIGEARAHVQHYISQRDGLMKLRAQLLTHGDMLVV